MPRAHAAMSSPLRQLAPVAEPPRFASPVYMPDERDAPGEEDTTGLAMGAHPDSVEASEERAIAALAHHELAAEAQQARAEPGLAASGEGAGAPDAQPAEPPLEYRQHSHNGAAEALASAAAYHEQAREQVPQHDDDASRAARASADGHDAASQPPRAASGAVEGQQQGSSRPVAFLSKLWA